MVPLKLSQTMCDCFIHTIMMAMLFCDESQPLIQLLDNLQIFLYSRKNFADKKMYLVKLFMT